MKKQIFTFWEPSQNIPGYIRICMKTWERFLSGYEIVILDYKNMSNYLPKKVISKILEKNMDLAMQSDCIRCAILREYGGIWIDADTVITSSEIFNKISSTDCHMIGRKNDNVLYGAFIYTAYPHTEFIDKWFNQLVEHVKKYRFCNKFRKLASLFRGLWDKTHRWDWCVNAIIDPLSKSVLPPKFDYTDKDEIGALPEFLSPMAKNIKNVEDKIDLYRKYYFDKGDEKETLDKTDGIILLHNSWTPQQYKDMTEQEFMKSGTRLAKILKTILK